jgi:hypothetical protein
VHDAAGRVVDRDGEAEPDAGDGRIDPDDASAAVGERAARVPGVQRGVGLDDVLDDAAGGLHRKRAAEGAHHARGDRPGEAHRIPDRDDELPHAEPRRLAELRRLEVGAALKPEHRQVRELVAADHVERDLPSVHERGRAAIRATHHVGRRQREPIGGDDHARARAVHPASAHALPNPEAGDRGDQAFGGRCDHARVRVERLLVRFRAAIHAFHLPALNAPALPLIPTTRAVT